MFDWQKVWTSSVVFDCSKAGSSSEIDHQTFDDSTGWLLPNIIHTVHIQSLSLDVIVNMDIFNRIFNGSCANKDKVCCNTKACFHSDLRGNTKSLCGHPIPLEKAVIRSMEMLT